MTTDGVRELFEGHRNAIVGMEVLGETFPDELIPVYSFSVGLMMLQIEMLL